MKTKIVLIVLGIFLLISGFLSFLYLSDFFTNDNSRSKIHYNLEYRNLTNTEDSGFAKIDNGNIYWISYGNDSIIKYNISSQKRETIFTLDEDQPMISNIYPSGDFIIYIKFTNNGLFNYTWEYYLFNQVTKENVYLDYISYFIVGEFEYPNFLCHDSDNLSLYNLISESKIIINETSWASLDGDSVYYRYVKEDKADIFIYSISQNERECIYESINDHPSVRGKNNFLVITESTGNRETNITIYNVISKELKFLMTVKSYMFDMTFDGNYLYYSPNSGSHQQIHFIDISNGYDKVIIENQWIALGYGLPDSENNVIVWVSEKDVKLVLIS